VLVRDVTNLDFCTKHELFEVFDERGCRRRVSFSLGVCFCDGRTRAVFEDIPVRCWVVVDERVMENSTLEERRRKPEVRRS